MLRYYSWMDLGIYSDFENEVDFILCENDVEMVSMVVVIIVECYMDVLIMY